MDKKETITKDSPKAAPKVTTPSPELILDWLALGAIVEKELKKQLPGRNFNQRVKHAHNVVSKHVTQAVIDGLVRVKPNKKVK